MATPMKKTQGSTLYVVDSSISPKTVIAIPYIKGLSNVGGGKASQLNGSNMDSGAYDEYAAGRAAPPEMSGELVLDKSNVGHQKAKTLFELSNAGTIGNLQIYVGDSDAANAPTLVLGVLTPPTSASPKKWLRSGTQGNAYISSFLPKKADNDLERADISLQWSGKGTWTVKGDVIAKTY
jgi:hypothetical protein